MRSYGGRVLKNIMERRMADGIESRDAVVISVDPLNTKYAVVKIQGSNKQIRAYFPQNWESVPSWCKALGSVRIAHVGGVRGRVEVTGMGQYRPTLLADDSMPDVQTSDDVILSGLQVLATQGNKMRVFVTTGTYLKSGVTTSVGAAVLNQSNWSLDMGGNLDGIAAVITVNAAPSVGQFRYDLLVIGTVDGVIDYVVGSASSAPVMPDTPSGHLLCGWILVTGGSTYITQSNISALHTAPYAVYMQTTIVDSELAWGEMSTNVTATLYDQYNNAFAATTTFTISITRGNGTLSCGVNSSGSSLAQLSTSGAVTFTYTRDGLGADNSPDISIASDIPGLAGNYITILLYDGSGNIMRT